MLKTLVPVLVALIGAIAAIITSNKVAKENAPSAANDAVNTRTAQVEALKTELSQLAVKVSAYEKRIALQVAHSEEFVVTTTADKGTILVGTPIGPDGLIHLSNLPPGAQVKDAWFEVVRGFETVAKMNYMEAIPAGNMVAFRFEAKPGATVGFHVKVFVSY